MIDSDETQLSPWARTLDRSDICLPEEPAHADPPPLADPEHIGFCQRAINFTGINALTCWFNESERHERQQPAATASNRTRKEEGTEMKKFGFAAVIASGLVAGVLGLAAPAQAIAAGPVSGTVISAGIDHHAWLDDIQPHVNVPRVDTSVQQSR